MVYPDFFLLFTNLFYLFIFLNKIQTETHIKKIKNTIECETQLITKNKNK